MKAYFEIFIPASLELDISQIYYQIPCLLSRAGIRISEGVSRANSKKCDVTEGMRWSFIRDLRASEDIANQFL